MKLHSTNFSFTDFHHTTFRHAFGTAFSVSYSSNGEFIAVGDDNGEIRLFFASNAQLHMRFVGHADVISSIAFSVNGELMASASFDNTVRLWSVRDGSLQEYYHWSQGLGLFTGLQSGRSNTGNCK